MSDVVVLGPSDNEDDTSSKCAPSDATVADTVGQTFAVNPQAASDGEEDVVMTSTSSANAIYAHARSDCSIHLFGSAPNHLFCDVCYCFVCDEPAKNCSQWLSHCAADAKDRVSQAPSSH
jgi:hypothetical protein